MVAPVLHDRTGAKIPSGTVPSIPFVIYKSRKPEMVGHKTSRGCSDPQKKKIRFILLFGSLYFACRLRHDFLFRSLTQPKGRGEPMGKSNNGVQVNGPGSNENGARGLSDNETNTVLGIGDTEL